MNIKSFFEELFRTKKSNSFTWTVGLERPPMSTLTNWSEYFERGFKTNALIFRCISLKARTASMVKLRAFTGTKDVPEPLPPEHPLSKLLRNPNPWQSWFEFQELAICYLNLAGNCYILFEPEDCLSQGKYPQNLWLLRPDRVKIVPKDGSLGGFLYAPHGLQGRGQKIYLPESIIHIRYPNPNDDLEGLGPGLSPLAAAAGAADIDNYVSDYINAFFLNAAIPYGILKCSSGLPKEEAERIKEAWQRQHRGPKHWHEVGILDADMEYQRIASTPEEFGFEALDARNEIRICAAFGVPPIIAGSKFGLERSTYSNYEMAWRQFMTGEMWSEYARFADGFNASLGSSDVWFEYDFSEVPFLAEPEERRWARVIDAYKTGVITLNEARGRIGLPPIEEQAEKSVLKAESSRREPPRHEQFVPLTAGQFVPLTAGQFVPLTAGQFVPLTAGRDEWLATGRDERPHIFSIESWRPSFTHAFRRRFETEKREVQDLVDLSWSERDIERFPSDLERYFSEAKEAWKRLALTLFESLAFEAKESSPSRAIRPAHGGAGRAVQAIKQYEAHDEEDLEPYAEEFSDQICDTSKEELSALALLAMRRGWSPEKLREEIGYLYDYWISGERKSEEEYEFRATPGRLALIVGTGLLHSAMRGKIWGLRERGIRMKRWEAIIDEKTCPICLALHGQSVELDAFFEGGYYAPPVHPNCRCIIVEG